MISHHYGDNKNRWGNFVYVCGNCSVDFSCTDNARETSVSDVAIQCCTPNHCKSAQSQPQFVTSGSQILISGNQNESSFSSVDSYINVCDSIHSDSIDSNTNMHDVSIPKNNNVLDNIKSLTKLNE